MGGKNISDDGLTLDGVVNTQPWIDAMTWYQKLVQDGIASQGYDADSLPDQFYSGNMVFMIRAFADAKEKMDYPIVEQGVFTSFPDGK